MAVTEEGKKQLADQKAEAKAADKVAKQAEKDQKVHDKAQEGLAKEQAAIAKAASDNEPDALDDMFCHRTANRLSMIRADLDASCSKCKSREKVAKALEAVAKLLG